MVRLWRIKELESRTNLKQEMTLYLEKNIWGSKVNREGVFECDTAVSGKWDRLEVKNTKGLTSTAWLDPVSKCLAINIALTATLVKFQDTTFFMTSGYQNYSGISALKAVVFPKINVVVPFELPIFTNDGKSKETAEISYASDLSILMPKLAKNFAFSDVEIVPLQLISEEKEQSIFSRVNEISKHDDELTNLNTYLSDTKSLGKKSRYSKQTETKYVNYYAITHSKWTENELKAFEKFQH